MKVATVATAAVLAFALACVAEELAGIGLDVIQRKNPNEPLRTKTVHPGSPAEKAGIKPDGFLISVDGTNVVSMSLTQAVKMVRGPVGTSVTVQLADSKMTHTNTFTIKRSRMVIVDNKMQFLDH
jgi:carboxyl-terminal processing protease